jgi:hypothetical protein
MLDTGYAGEVARGLDGVLTVLDSKSVSKLVDQGPTYSSLYMGIVILLVPIYISIAPSAWGAAKLTSLEYVAALTVGLLLIGLGSFLQLYKFRTLTRLNQSVTEDYLEFEKGRTDAISRTVANSTKLADAGAKL